MSARIIIKIVASSKFYNFEIPDKLFIFCDNVSIWNDI